MTDITKSEIDAQNAGEVVNTIILWRIYDVLMLMLSLQDKETALNLTRMHENGDFLGPNPAYRPDPEE